MSVLLRGVTAIVLLLLVSAGPSAAQASPRAERVTPQSLVEQFSGGLGIATNNAAPPVLAIGYAVIMEFEGWVPNYYNDPSNYCTIGYGHLIGLRRCTASELAAPPITRAAGYRLLQRDTRYARSAVLELVDVELDDQQYSALTSFVFNVGARNFERSTLLRLINDELFEEAADQFARWRYSGGRSLPGLTTRRACEAALFRGELSMRNNRIYREDCTALGVAATSLPGIDVVRGEGL